MIHHKNVKLVPLPSKFNSEIVWVLKDLVGHLKTFKAHISFYGFNSKIVCQIFPLTFKGEARGWLKRKRPKSIASYDELAINSLLIHENPKKEVSNIPIDIEANME